MGSCQLFIDFYRGFGSPFPLLSRKSWSPLRKHQTLVGAIYWFIASKKTISLPLDKQCHAYSRNLAISAAKYQLLVEDSRSVEKYPGNQIVIIVIIVTSWWCNIMRFSHNFTNSVLAHTQSHTITHNHTQSHTITYQGNCSSARGCSNITLAP